MKKEYVVPGNFIQRKNYQWIVKCKNGDINAEECHNAFLDANALNRKDHQCFNCNLGKAYRQKRAEGAFDLTFKDMIFKQQ